MPDSIARRRVVAESSLPWAVCAVVFVFYLLTCCPTVYFGDSGELIAAADCFGVAHPPGYPLYTTIGHVALLLPFGEPAWRMNALSALFGALTCGLVCRLLYRWTGSPLAAAAAGSALAVSFGFWTVSTVAEVYTIHLFFLVALLLLADRLRELSDGRKMRLSLVLAGLVLGLGLSHRPTILLALPAALVLAGGVGPRAWRNRRVGSGAWVLAAALALGLPLLAYGTLMLRAAAEPALNWGRPVDPASLLALVTTRSFRFYVLGPAGWLRADGWARVGQLLWQGFGFVGAPLALLGLGSAFLRGGFAPKRRATAVLLLGAVWLLFGLSYGTEDAEVLFLPLLLVAALFAGLGLAAVQQVLGPRRWLPTCALAVTLIGAPLALHLDAANLAEVRAGAEYGRDMLLTVPENGVLFVEGDDAFLLAYLQQVLGERTDVKIYDRNGLMFADLLREPGSPAFSGESPLLFRVRREQEFIANEPAEPRPRAVLFMTWPGYSLPPAFRFEPEGLFYRVRRSHERPLDTSGLWESYREESVIEQAERTRNPFALTVAATYPLMRGERLLFERRVSEAVSQFDRASRLARSSETIHNYLGTIYGRLGDLPRAEERFLEALRIKPVSIRAWNNLARARLLSGDLDAARAAWGSSLAVEPNQPETRRLLQQYSR